ncbi:hypothetical protein ES703_86123 [subsurface metagenome]
MPLGNLPLTTIFTLSGSRSHNLPVAKTTAVSVVPIPLLKAPIAPYEVVWESFPKISIPGKAWHFSTIT